MDFDSRVHVFRSPAFRGVIHEAVEFFDSSPTVELPPPARFNGVGVYGLYFRGKYKLYAPVATQNRERCAQPIYVGKAVPPGWRAARSPVSDTPDLYRRLREHARSIAQVSNLNVDEFRCRFVILADVEVDLVGALEAELIRRFRPLWNVAIDGFGNHNPGSGRYNQAPSEWDVLHPGRPWVSRLTGKAPKRRVIVAKIRMES